MSKRLYDKLEKYEDEAYAKHFGQDWTEDVYQLFKKYLYECATSGRRASLTGFERSLDNYHKTIWAKQKG